MVWGRTLHPAMGGGPAAASYQLWERSQQKHTLPRRRQHLSWGKWLPIENRSSHNGPAVYQIRAVQDHSPLTLARLLGPDHSGVLSIGETGAFEKRRQQFCRGLRSGAGHSEANLIWVLGRTTPVDSLLAEAHLQYRIQACDSKKAAVALEKDIIWAYAMKFGEVPPFNSSFPGRSERISKHRRAAR